MTLSVTITLGEVATFIRGITFKPEDVVPVGTEGAVVCLRTKNIQTDLDLADAWAVDSSLVRRDEQFLRPGDILISSANSWNLVGKCNWIPELPWRASFGGFVSVLRADPEKISPRYLFWWFSSSRIQALARSFGNKTTSISNLNIERCLSLSLELPSLSEQYRIAAILDQLESLRAKRRVALQNTAALATSIFFELFGNQSHTPVTIGDALEKTSCGWAWELLTDVARIATGHTPDRKKEEYWGGDIPWLSLTDIRRLDLAVATETGECTTKAGIENSSSVILPSNTVCFSRTASVGFVTIIGREMATSQDFFNWVCGPRLEPAYLMYSLFLSRSRLRLLSNGSTHKTIYFPTAKRFRVLVPPIELQKKFASRLSAIERMKSIQSKHLLGIEALFTSLQHRAFRGEL